MALIPSHYLNAVVSIGIGDDPATRRWVGTAFCYGLPMDDSKYFSVLATNKHVIEGNVTVWVKFNKSGGADSTDFRMNLVDPSGYKFWTAHPTADAAAVWINLSHVHDEGHEVGFVRSDKDVEFRQQLQERNATEGDGIFLLGFPMNLVDPHRRHVICRLGCLARIRGLHENPNTTDYLVDALSFPGNSGGPVLIRPEATALRGTQPTDRSLVIGMVQGYVPYHDVAISKQTGRPRVVFEENSGLSVVLPMDVVHEVARLEHSRYESFRQQSSSP